MIRYVPKPLTEEVNVTHGSPLKPLFIMLGGIACIVLLVFVVAGVVVDQLAVYVPTSVERSMGVMFDGSFPLDTSDEGKKRARHLEQLLRTLTPYLDAGDTRLQYSVGITKNEDVNAVALPGGRILFFSGLLDELESDEETLFVLAHELGHFHARDHLRKMGRGLLLLVIAGALSSAGQDTSSLLGIIPNSVELAYSRDQERDADLFALALLKKATGSTQGATAFMRKLEKMKGDTSQLYFFSTHPSPTARRKYLEEQAALWEKGRQ